MYIKCQKKYLKCLMHFCLNIDVFRVLEKCFTLKKIKKINCCNCNTI